MMADMEASKPVENGSENEEPEGAKENNAEDKDVEMAEEGSGDDDEDDKDKSDFSSEKFKIELHGLPKFYGIGQIKKLLNQISLSPHRIKPAGPGNPYLFISFKNEKDRQAALDKLEGYEWKKSVFSAKKAGPAPAPVSKKRKKDIIEDEPLHVEDGGEGIKRTKAEDEDETLTITEKIRKATIPWVDIDYQQQLMDKHKEAELVLKNLGSGLKKGNRDLSTWLKAQKGKYDGLCCELYNTRASPKVQEYRNKCEFSIGFNPENNERTIGFRLSSYKEGSIGVAPIEELSHLPQKMKSVVKKFEYYVRESSLEPYNPETHEGFWKQLTVRLTRAGDLMVIVIMHPQSLNDAAVNKVKQDVTKFFIEQEGKELGVTSLYFQSIGQRESGVTYPFELLSGEKYIKETINELTFQISPDSFFQTNTEGAELLYQSLAEIADLDSSTTLLDVCCGTGTIGVSMSKIVGQVLGLDVVEEAVECARVNAFANEMLNCQFFAGKAETILNQVMNKVLFKDVVAIVDPPRAGLQGKAMGALRRCEAIKKLVYVSCDPKLATKNFLDLGRPYSNTFQGEPFVPVKAIPIDMFPNTPHLEMVILFERFDPEKYPLPEQTRFYSNKAKVQSERREDRGRGDGMMRGRPGRFPGGGPGPFRGRRPVPFDMYDDRFGFDDWRGYDDRFDDFGPRGYDDFGPMYDDFGPRYDNYGFPSDYGYMEGDGWDDGPWWQGRPDYWGRDEPVYGGRGGGGGGGRNFRGGWRRGNMSSRRSGGGWGQF